MGKFTDTIFESGEKIRDGFISVYPDVFNEDDQAFGLFWENKNDHIQAEVKHRIYRINIKLKENTNA